MEFQFFVKRVALLLAAQVFAMTNDVRSALATCITNPPDDLVALYSSAVPANPRLGIKILELAEASKYTRAIQEHSLLGKPMGLFALDDANDSNPFCYITRGPARGCILHLFHDDDTAVEYPSLAAFLKALKTALENQLHIDDLSGKDFRPKLDQELLGNHISRLVEADTDAAECELTVLARLLDTERVDSVRSLVQHPSFFVREAAAQLIASHPNVQLIAMAESLANDPHPQVARPGKTALSTVKRVV
jgi:hypothetical protein